MHRNPGLCRTTPAWQILWRNHGRRILRLRNLLLLAAVLLAVMKATGEPPQWLLQRTESTAVLIVACVVYALLLAVPFVPSVEIGLLIMILFGAPGALGAHLATCMGLTTAYLIGRRIAGVDLLRRASLPAHCQGRLHCLAARLPGGVLPILSLATLLNLPGNTALGGGGGIAMAYGAGRFLTLPVFIVTVAMATAVLPVAFVTGLVGLERMGVGDT